MAFTFDNDQSSIAGVLTIDPSTSFATVAGTQGLVIPSGTIAQRPVSPTAGLMRNNTDLGLVEQYVNGAWQPVSSPGGRGFGSFFDDFIMDASQNTFGEGWIKTLTGTGASVVSVAADVTSANNSAGVIELATGTQATGQAAAYLSLGSFVLGYGQFYTEWRVMFPVLSSATQDYVYQVGFQDQFNTNPDTANGVYFLYHSQTTTTFRCKTVAATVTTTTDTGLTVVANTWYKLGILINAAGTSVQFYINDVLEQTNTTNIPTLPMGWGNKNYKMIGTTSRVAAIDYAQLIYTPTTVR